MIIDRQGKVFGRYPESADKGKALLMKLLGLSEESAGEARGGPAPKVPDWRKRFDAVYRLENGQTLKRIAPPFIPERLEYYRQELTDQAQLVPVAPTYFSFLWDGKRGDPGYGFTNKTRLTDVLRILGLRRNEYDGPPEFLNLKVPGDWIVRESSSRADRLRALEAILRSELGRSIRFERRQVRRNVIVARGQYAFRPLTGIATRAPDAVHLFVNRIDADEGAGGGTGDLGKLLAHLESRLNRWVVNEAEAPGGTIIEWRNHRSSKLRDLPDGNEKAARIDGILENLSRQTSLQFVQEDRNVDVWFVTGQGGTRPE